MEEALRRGWENLIGRSDGPMNFRLLLQPAVAIFFAIRAGLRDARNGQPPFLWAFFSNPGSPKPTDDQHGKLETLSDDQQQKRKDD